MKNNLKKKLKRVIEYYSLEELALGYLRYEALRKLNPAQFNTLCRKNIMENKFFDSLVDELVEKLD